MTANATPAPTPDANDDPYYPVDLLIAAKRLRDHASFWVTLPRIDEDEQRRWLHGAVSTKQALR